MTMSIRLPPGVRAVLASGGMRETVADIKRVNVVGKPDGFLVTSFIRGKKSLGLYNDSGTLEATLPKVYRSIPTLKVSQDGATVRIVDERVPVRATAKPVADPIPLPPGVRAVLASGGMRDTVADIKRVNVEGRQDGFLVTSIVRGKKGLALYNDFGTLQATLPQVYATIPALKIVKGSDLPGVTVRILDEPAGK